MYCCDKFNITRTFLTETQYLKKSKESQTCVPSVMTWSHRLSGTLCELSGPQEHSVMRQNGQGNKSVNPGVLYVGS